MDELDLTLAIREETHLEALATGPCIVVANHPFGGVDALSLTQLLSQLRPDTKMLANFLMKRVPELADTLIFVDPFGGATSKLTNLQAMRQALRHLQAGGVLGIFPSGTVSHWHWRHFRVTDPPWSTHLASLARRAKAPILPIYVHGRNRWPFQLAGMLHPLIRTALLPREMVNKRSRTITITVGKVIPARQLLRFQDEAKLTSFVRAATYLLRKHQGTPKPDLSQSTQAPIAEAVPNDRLVEEIDSLPAEAKLVTQQGFEVYITTKAQSPLLVAEIGRLREITFREIGEGTGKPSDLDTFDDHYEHLLLWSPQEEAIIGAYRLARVDEVMAVRGLNGLYTATLYKFKPGFLTRMGGALELGRSFIVARHQKQRHSLMLLWCGIGAYLTKNPQYHTLFGPVSMSQDYTSLSKQLLVWFIKKTHRHPVLAKLVKANHPFRAQDQLGAHKHLISDCIESIDDVSALMSEFESDGKGVPILFKQYLRMNALLLSFSVDKQFSNVLDGLVVADLRTADPKVLRKYFGDEGLKIFLDYHRAAESKGSGAF